MPTELQGQLTADGMNFALVVSRFNSFITDKLLTGALDTIARHGGDAEGATIVRVPGSLEAPLAARKLAESGKYDAVLVLAAVIRGGTVHFDVVVKGIGEGVTRTSLETGVPVIFGVVTTDTIEQAVERAGTKMGNAGSSAAAAAIEMADLMRKL